MNHKRINVFAIFIVLASVLSGCRKDDNNTPGPETDKASVMISFTHSVGNMDFIKDSLRYNNTAGNHYEVNDLQYFISDIILHKQDGGDVMITADNGIHYVDIDLSGTLLWNVAQEIPTGEYSSVSFTFGINESKNKTGLFVNPPERDMFWPEPMGGGYHYMKMNGQWVDTLNNLTPFNFHLGIGMMDNGMGGMDYIQNYFTVQVPNSAVTMQSGHVYKLGLKMNIASWFDTPNVWDWNVTGGQIMQKQWAMHMACENGVDAFSCLWSVE
jgi:hypothetical protein